MTGDRHCGYANYETFTIAVVVENDRKLITEARALLADVETVARRSVWADVHLGDMADACRAWVEARFIDPVCQDGATHHGIAATLCNAALGQVDWLELVEEWTKEEGQ